MNTTLHKAWIALAVSICCPLYLVAQNLVINGSFDTNTTGWTANIAKDYQPSLGNPPGCVGLNDPSLQSVPTISQVVTGLTTGVSYTVTGDYKELVNWGGGAPTNSSFGVAVDGVFEFEDTQTDSVWHSFGFTFIAPSSTTTLSLSAQMNGTGVAYLIDNIVMQPTPSVKASIVGADFVLSWPTNALGFVIQSSTNLVTGSWLDATSSPVIVGSNYSIALSATQESCYFRLKR
jgi:hypothetical protein